MDDKPAHRHSIFAVWRWRWWTWCAAVVAIPIAYLLTAVPMMILAHSIEDHFPQSDLAARFFNNVDAFYDPAFLCAEDCRVLRRFYDWQWDAICELVAPSST